MHPIDSLHEWFPDCDFAVLDHGFAPHGRDYVFLVETNMGKLPGRHILQFTHVVEMRCETRVSPETWRASWGNEFTDYEAWQAAGEPEGYVWGTEWSLAWPGMAAVEPSEKAASWSERLSQAMYEVSIETDRFSLTAIFHSLHTQPVSDETGTVSRVVHLLQPDER